MGKRTISEEFELEDIDSSRGDNKRFKQMESKKRSHDEPEEQDSEDGHVAKCPNNSQERDSDAASTDGASSSASLSASPHSNIGSSISSSDTMTSSDDEYEDDYEGEDESSSMIMSSPIVTNHAQAATSLLHSPMHVSPGQPDVNNRLNYRDHHNVETPESLAVSATPGTTDSLEGIRFAPSPDFSPIRMGALNLENQGIAAEEGNYASFYGLTTAGVVIALGGLMADFCG